MNESCYQAKYDKDDVRNLRKSIETNIHPLNTIYALLDLFLFELPFVKTQNDRYSSGKDVNDEYKGQIQVED